MARRALVLPVVLASVVAATGCITPIRKDLSDVSPNARVRVWHKDTECCASPLIGTLVSYDADSVRVRVPTQEQPIALSRASISYMESASRVGRGGTGALIGLGVGTTVGAIVGYGTSCSHCDGDWRPLGAIVGGVGGAIVGTLAGLIVGLATRRDGWDTVSP